MVHGCSDQGNKADHYLLISATLSGPSRACGRCQTEISGAMHIRQSTSSCKRTSELSPSCESGLSQALLHPSEL